MTQPDKALTIDGPGSRDLDDALWVEHDGGKTVLHVYIADAAAAVPIGSPADLRAAEMIETRYFASGNSPMLPRKISEGEASLLPGQVRSALRITLVFLSDGTRTSCKIHNCSARSVAQLHYGQVPEILGRPDHALHGQIRDLDRLAKVLLAGRRAAGALALYDLREGLLTSEEGILRKTEWSTIGHVIVQEAMIAANLALAEMCLDQHVPILFRNHEASAAAPPRAEMQRWLTEMLSAPHEIVVQRAKVLEAVLERARYGTELRGHFGLSLGAYLHGTSPIRRLADLLNHRQIRAHLLGEPLPYGRGDLELFAARINEFGDLQRKQKSAHLKEKADQLLARRAQGDLGYLEPKAFSRILKLACRAGTPSGKLSAEIAARCTAGRMMPLDAYFVLWADPAQWADPQKCVAAFLAANPHAAASVAAISATMAAADGAPQIVTDHGLRRGSSFGSSASCWGIVASGTGHSKKAAEQNAVVRLVCERVGVEAAEPPPQAPAQASAPAAKTLPLPDPETLNPISDLQCYCQSWPTDLPTYTFEEVSARGAILFSCEVSAVLGGKQLRGRSGPRPSKRDAKRDAAADAIRKLPAVTS